MTAILDFLGGFADLVLGAFDFLLGTLRDLVWILGLIVRAVGAIPSYFSWLPAPVVSLLGVAVGVASVYKFLGRDG